MRQYGIISGDEYEIRQDKNSEHKNKSAIERSLLLIVIADDNKFGIGEERGCYDTHPKLDDEEELK